MSTRLDISDDVVEHDFQPRDAKALKWYLQGDYAGDIGVSSNFMSMVSQLEARAKCVPPKEDPDPRYAPRQYLFLQETRNSPGEPDVTLVVASARKLKKIEARWKKLDLRTQLVVSLLVLGDFRPRAWGALGSVILFQRSSHAAYAEAKPKVDIAAWLVKVASSPTHIVLNMKLKSEASRHAKTALATWDNTY